MSPRRLSQLAVCALVAGAVTTAAYFADHLRQRDTQIHQALRWARQIASQAESLTLEGREKNPGQDSVGWAARILSQGTDSRILTVSKFQSTLSSPTPEMYTLDSEKGVFDYSKFIDFEENSGLRVKLFVGSTGFLGARTQLAHDLSVATMFALVFLIGMAWSGPFFGFKKDSHLRQSLLAWITDFKNLLTQLGVHIRALIQEASTLATAVKTSRATLASVRDHLHAELTQLRTAQSQARDRDGVKSSQRAEVLARFIAKELASRTSADSPLHLMSAELHRLVLGMLQTQKENQALLKSAELRIEPIATDVDVAFHAYDDVFRVTENMSAQIRKTTETLLDQARLMRDLKNDAEKNSKAS